jgi:hypothetical protein
VRRLPKTNSAFCWIKEGEGVSTLLYVYNYWSENYGMARVRIRWILCDRNGRRLGKGIRELRPDETAVIPAAALLAEAGVTAPFEGNVVLELSDRRLQTGRPLQMLGEYHSAAGAVSCVHGQWGFYERSRARGAAAGHIHVLADADYETYIVTQNCSPSRRAADARANTPRVTFFAARGEARTVEGKSIAPWGFDRYSVATMLPGGEAFLRGGGNASVQSWTPSIRTFYYHRHRRDGSISVNHAAGDYAALPARSAPLSRAALARFGRGPLTVALAWSGEGIASRYVLHNNYVPVGTHAFDVSLFDLDGVLKLELKEDLVLSPRETRVVLLTDLLSRAGMGPAFKGTVQFALSLREVACPSVFQLVPEYIAGDRLSACDVGSDVYTPDPSQRTKIFARAVETATRETFVCVAHPSSDPAWTAPSGTTISLIAGDGSARLATEVAIPIQGALFAPVATMFPDAARFLERSGGVGLLKVRDVTARLMGYHLVRDRPSGALAIDHLFGG